MPKYTKNKVSLSYEVHGTGKPIILLHGAVVDFNYNGSLKNPVCESTKNLNGLPIP